MFNDLALTIKFQSDKRIGLGIAANGLAAFELNGLFKLIELDAPNRFVVLSSSVFVEKPLDLFPLHRVNEL